MIDVTVNCDDCNSLVELIRHDSRRLGLVCDCGEMRTITVSRPFPEGWE